MSADSYFLFALLGPLMGFLLLVGALPLLIYSFCARNARRGVIASRIALVLSLLSVLASTILWIELLSGRYRNGDPVNYYDGDFAVYEIIAAFEALALLISFLSVVRQSAPPLLKPRRVPSSIPKRIRFGSSSS